MVAVYNGAIHRATLRLSLIGAALITGIGSLADNAHAAPRLSLPVACTMGETCFVQQYPDVDAGPDHTDYTCGTATYNGHKGTDIRVRTLKEIDDGVAIIAAEGGTVRAIRNTEPDRIVKSQTDRQKIKGKECGNGLVIRHDNGWETQYCHMRQNSIIVKPGETVERGTALGLMGYSGDAAFPHLHLSVRKDGKPVDPFTGNDLAAGCGLDRKKTLWLPETDRQLDEATGQILGSGITNTPPDFNRLQQTGLDRPLLKTDSPAMVLYLWAINLARGDTLTLTLDGPGGFSVKRSETMDRNRAQQFLFTGKKQPQGGWPKGIYTGTLTLTRNNKVIKEQRHSLIIED